MTSMTQTTSTIVNDLYAKALARARKSGIHIVGRGHLRDAERTPFVAVSSSKEPNRAYIVGIFRTRLICDCYAGLRGTLCQHRALVHERLIALWRMERDRIEREEESALRQALHELNEQLSQPASTLLSAAGVLTAPSRGVAPVISQHQADALLDAPRSAHEREPIRGFSDTRAFSLFK